MAGYVLYGMAGNLITELAGKLRMAWETESRTIGGHIRFGTSDGLGPQATASGH
ncbi:hypothetical protein D8674_019703 [Pyrus ussuriensis x Pyrus communis]|uniref:Uncharacterized protein n=1 Tax=Pyrus ussuriensis x Pyrus communis TaxID=2448454 RepID=A0A5N5GD36_9ROSA|nr:hypothetical protein D8674_019703 [Pyrus ussuriensis x Pyrus communis]